MRQKIKCSKFTEAKNVKIDYEINPYSCCIDCGFRKEQSDLLNV